jgi:hypothetical protein
VGIVRALSRGDSDSTSKLVRRRFTMTLLRRVISTLVVLLIVTPGIGNLWSIEINEAEGRPWDSGNIKVVNLIKEATISEKNPNHYVVTPGINPMSHENREQYFKSFEVFLNDMLSFLY